MDALKLDRRVVLQRKTITRGEANAPLETWTVLATVWASKRDVTDVERLRADEVGSALTTRFAIRWSTDVDDLGADDRLIFDGRTYNIEGVREIGRHDGLEINATARQEAGAQ